jgi:hypothetical protein
MKAANSPGELLISLRKYFKKIYFLILPFLFVTSFIISCENEEQVLTGKITASSGCKSTKTSGDANDTPGNQSCAYYKYNRSDKKLLIEHINAGFNCCPEKLSCYVAMNSDTLTIWEYEKAALCNCNCLFDLDIEISGILSKKYQVKFVEPYSGNQEKIIFEADLGKNPEGSFCVIRKQYPWGLRDTMKDDTSGK